MKDLIVDRGYLQVRDSLRIQFKKLIAGDDYLQVNKNLKGLVLFSLIYFNKLNLTFMFNSFENINFEYGLFICHICS